MVERNVWSGATVQPPAPRGPQRRRRRWVWGVLIVVAVIILLVLALPSLLCTGPGVRLIESQINSRIRGKASIGGLSLGWFTPAQVRDLTLRDPNGAVVLDGVNVTTHLSLWRVLTNHEQLGTITIAVRRVRLAASKTGQLNLAMAIASRAAPPGAPAAPAAKPEPLSTVATQPQLLPPLAVGLDCQIKRLSWSGPGVPTLQARNLNLTAVFNTAGEPLQLLFKSQVRVAKEAPTRVRASANLTIFRQRRLLPPAEMAGHIRLHVHHFDLGAVDTILASLGRRLRLQGMLNMHLVLTKTGGRRIRADVRGMPSAVSGPVSAGSIQGQVTVQGLVLGGPMLHGDTPHFGKVSIPVNVSWNAGRFVVSSFAVNSGLGTVSVQGAGDIAALQGVLQHRPAGAAQAKLQIRADTQLARLFQQLPHHLKAPFGMKFRGGQAQMAADFTLGPDAGGHASAAMSHAPPAGPAAEGATRLPALAGRVHFSLRALQWNSAGERVPRIANARGSLAFATTGQPVGVDIGLTVTHGAHPAASFLLRGTLNIFHQRRVLPFNRFTGAVHLEVHQLNLRYPQTLLAGRQMPLTADGVLNGTVDLEARQAGAGTIRGQLQIDGLACHGPLLKSDRPQFGRLVLPIDVAWQGEQLHIHRLGLESPMLRLLASGSTNLSSLRAMGNPGANWGAGNLRFSSRCNLGLAAANFPQTLGLAAHGLNLAAGTLRLSGRLDNHGVQSNGAVQLALSEVTGTYQKRKFQLNPVWVQVSAQRNGKAWKIREGDLKQATQPSATSPVSTQLALHLAAGVGTTPTYTLRLDAALARLYAEAAPLVNWQGRSISGALHLTLAMAQPSASRLTYHTRVALQNLAVALAAQGPPVRQSRVLLESRGTIRAPHHHLQSVHAKFSLRTAELDVSQGVLALQTKPTGALSTVAVQLNVERASLAALSRLLAPYIPALRRYRLSGTISRSSVMASATPRQMSLSRCHLVLNRLGLATTTARFQEPKLTLDLAGSARTAGAFQATLKHFSLQTADGAAGVQLPQAVSVAEAKPGGLALACPSVQINSNLLRLEPLLITLGVMKAGEKLQGQLHLTGQVQSHGKRINLGVQAAVQKYQLTSPKAALTLPPTNIAANVQGRWDRVRQTFSATRTCSVSETAIQGGGSDQVVLAKGSMLSLTPAAPENIHLQVAYDLARLESLLQPLLPKGLVMAGRHRMNLAITGRLGPGPGLKKFRNLTLAPASFTFDNITIDGVKLGPGAIRFQQQGGILTLLPSRIPANQGQLNLAGQVNLNRPVPIFSLREPLPVAENIQLNGKLGGTLLRFIPLTWGTPSHEVQVEGVLSMTLQNAHIPLQSQALQQTGTLAGTFSITHLTTNSPLYGLIGNLVQPLGTLNGSNLQMRDSGIRKTSFHLAQGKLYYQNLNVLMASYGMDFSGWVAMNRQLNVQVGVSGQGLTLPIPLAISGTTDKPKVHLSGKPLKNIGRTLKQLPNFLGHILGH